jgi:hypothetical protein
VPHRDEVAAAVRRRLDLVEREDLVAVAHAARLPQRVEDDGVDRVLAVHRSSRFSTPAQASSES